MTSSPVSVKDRLKDKPKQKDFLRIKLKKRKKKKKSKSGEKGSGIPLIAALHVPPPCDAAGTAGLQRIKLHSLLWCGG